MVFIQKEIIEDIESQEKMYSSSNREMLKKAQDLYTLYYDDNLTLRNAKEDYEISMKNLLKYE